MKYLATTASTLIILVAVLLPGSTIPDVNIIGIDKVVHFLLFVMWSICLRRDFGDSFKWWAGLIAGFIFSVLTEILQIAVEGRTFDYTDIIADMIGLAFGILAGKLVLQWLQRYLKI